MPVNKTAEQAHVVDLAPAADWRLEVTGPAPFTLTLAELEALATATRRFPISCVEGWSVGADWRGVRLLDLVRAGRR